MENKIAQVPASLLLTPDLPATAKLVWMIRTLAPGAGPSGLAAASGLSRPTVTRALAQLAASGWDKPTADVPTVPIPGMLLTNSKLGAQARVLYGLLLLTPGYSHPCGDFTYEALAGLAHASRNTVATAIRELVHAEWIKADRANRLDRIHFDLTFPGFAQGLAALDRAQRRLDKAKHFGEALMREYLTLLSDRTNYEDDANLGFLINPRTEELLQFDRFYPPDVAFEFNGPQHYRETEQFSEAEVIAQRERDLIKAGLCVEHRVTLVVVLPEDLTLKGMRQKVGDLLPLRDLTGYELLIDHLESESERYRRLISLI